jgi:hypothetical protein
MVFGDATVAVEDDDLEAGADRIAPCGGDHLPPERYDVGERS